MILNLLGRTFKQLTTKIKSLFFISIILGSLSAGLESLSLVLLMPFVKILVSQDEFSSNTLQDSFYFINFNNGDIFKNFIFFLIFIYLLSGFIRVLNIKFNSVLSARIGHSFSNKLMKNIFSQDFLFFNKNSVGYICSNADYSLTKVVGTIFALLQSLVAFLVAISLFLTVSISIGSITFILIIFTGIFYILIAKYVQRKYRNNSERITFSISDQNQKIKDALSSLPDFIIYNEKEKLLSNYKSVDFKLRRSIAQNDYLSSVPRIIIESSSIVFVLMVVLISQNYGYSNTALISKIGLFVVASQRLLPSLQVVYSGWSTLMRFSNELKQVLYFLELKPFYNLNNLSSIRNINFKKINLIEVSYEYQISNKQKQKQKNNFSIKNINIEIEANNMISIFGPSGSGKTTLVNLISGLIKPKNGSILVDNQNINESSDLLQRWQSSIAFVPQTIYLRGSSIFENITSHKNVNDVNMEWFFEILNICEIKDLYLEEQGFKNSRVGEGGSRLSGGQKQRIAIAKAVFSKRKLIILDEPTSGLDYLRQNKIINLLRKLSKSNTIIIITHSEFVSNSCDFQIKFNNGKIKEIVNNN